MEDLKVMKEMASLPRDLVVEILSRLSVKNLSKLRCVCKLWLQLISDPHLLHLHSLRSKPNPLLVFSSLQYSDPKTDPFSLQYSDSNTDRSRTLHLSCMDMEGKVIHRLEKRVEGYVRMLPSRFELVCLYGTNDQYYVCNPTTLEFITLPVPTQPHCYTLNSVGFGYIPSTKEYKVVRLYYPHKLPPSRKRCQVLTLGSSSWRAAKDPPIYDLHTDPPAFVHGALHWMSRSFILAFDIETEEFRVVQYPESFEYRWEVVDGFFNLVELGGLLCLTLAGIKKKNLDIWVLKDYKNHVWAKEYSIDLNTMDPYDESHWHWFPINICDGIIFIQLWQKGLNYYDLQRKTYKRFEIGKMFSCPEFSFYVESFCSLGSGIKPQGISIGS